MYEFKINFKNHTCYGDHYTVWFWNNLKNDWITIIDKIYYANSQKEILNMIKHDVKQMFNIKNAKWIINKEN